MAALALPDLGAIGAPALALVPDDFCRPSATRSCSVSQGEVRLTTLDL
jgi:hypothetical protein